MLWHLNDIYDNSIRDLLINLYIYINCLLQGNLGTINYNNGYWRNKCIRNPLVFNVVFSYLGIYSVKVISTEIYMLECPLDKDFVTKLMKTKPYSYFGYSTNSRWIGQLKQINFVLLIAVWTFSLNVVHDSTLFVICLSYVGLDQGTGFCSEWILFTSKTDVALLDANKWQECKCLYSRCVGFHGREWDLKQNSI